MSDGRGLFFSFFSVGQPFQGAYLEINKNPKYKKLKDAIDEKIIIAEVVNKINRANGKVNAPPAGCGPRLSAGTASVLVRMLKFALHFPSRVAVRGVVSPCLPGSEAFVPVDGMSVNYNVLPVLHVFSVRIGVPGEGYWVKHAFLQITNALLSLAIGGVFHPQFCILFCFVSSRAPPGFSS